MATRMLEQRMTAVEHELMQLTEQLQANPPQAATPWWEQIFGTFADSEAHEEATPLGRQYRESLQPKGDDLNG